MMSLAMNSNTPSSTGELPDCPFRDRPQGTEGVLKLFFVHTEKRLPVILEKSMEGAVRETSRVIGHVRLSGGRVKGGIDRRLQAGGVPAG